MANRAYLYNSDEIEFGNFRAEPPYYDSRHTIPIGWFFYFASGDVLMAPYGGWEEPKLAAVKKQALERFVSRRPQLEPYLASDVLRKAADGMVVDLERWPGEFLLMEPTEVVDGADEIHRRNFEAILQALDATNPDATQIDVALRRYSGQLSPDPDRRLGEVLGYTYSWGT